MWPFRRRPAAPSVPTPELARLRDELARVKRENERLRTALDHQAQMRVDEAVRNLALIKASIKQDETIARLQATQQKQPRDAAGRFAKVAP